MTAVGWSAAVPGGALTGAALPMPREASTASGSRRRTAGVLGGIVGLAAAGVAAGFAAERALRRRRQHSVRDPRDPYRDEPFGALPADEYRTVTTGEGIPLHVEITGPLSAPLTVVFVHGFCLDMGTFHFQRKALSTMDGVRTISYDQPGHGRSGRLAKGEYTLDMLGSALRKVLEECTSPASTVVLVGHSMGGMTIMALADLAPEIFSPGGRVAGVSMISTSAGGVTFGLPEVLGRFRKPLLPLLSGAGQVTAGMLDRAREASTDLAWLLTRRYGFGSAPASPALVSYVERMNAATRTESVARYLRTLYSHDRVLALSAFKQIPVLVICGEEDLLTPVEHSRALCEALPHADLIVIDKGGHVALLEHNVAVNAVLLPFVRKIDAA
jgi:pimeloyl-ACP methyl ester carboxylesterase